MTQSAAGGPCVLVVFHKSTLAKAPGAPPSHDTFVDVVGRFLECLEGLQVLRLWSADAWLRVAMPTPAVTIRCVQRRVAAHYGTGWIPVLRFSLATEVVTYSRRTADHPSDHTSSHWCTRGPIHSTAWNEGVNALGAERCHCLTPKSLAAVSLRVAAITSGRPPSVELSRFRGRLRSPPRLEYGCCGCSG
jgi:hypothetical protein